MVVGYKFLSLMFKDQAEYVLLSIESVVLCVWLWVFVQGPGDLELRLSPTNWLLFLYTFLVPFGVYNRRREIEGMIANGFHVVFCRQRVASSRRRYLAYPEQVGFSRAV